MYFGSTTLFHRVFLMMNAKTASTGIFMTGITHTPPLQALRFQPEPEQGLLLAKLQAGGVVGIKKLLQPLPLLPL